MSDYISIVSDIMTIIDANTDRIILGVMNKLEDNLVPTKDLWALKFFNDSNFVIIGGNLDMAILEMDSYLKRKNKTGTINHWIKGFIADFEEEIEDFIYTYDNEEDPNFGDRIKNTFTLENVIHIMYDKLKETIEDNDSIWLEPVTKIN